MVPFDDHSTIIDELGRLSLADKLATSVMTCTPPRVFGVHGDWGAGKTSFLQQLHRILDGIPSRERWVKSEQDAFKLLENAKAVGTRTIKSSFPEQRYDGKDEVLVVWFEAWRYQNEPAPVVALLHEMRGQLGSLARLKNQTLKIAEVTIRSGLLQLEQIAKFAWLQSAAGITVANKGSGIVATVQDQGERWEREHLAEKLPAEAIREQLENAINQLLGRDVKKPPGEGRRVVVLIDDLDRCEPQATYRLLEGIKIYLNIPNCVFVLGMDQRIIIDAVAESAPGAKDDAARKARRAREYLEKLFQEIYHLPIVQNVPEHLMAWLQPEADAGRNATRQTIRNLLENYHGSIPANPRKIKAFAAVLRRFLHEPSSAEITAAKFSPVDGQTELAAKHPYESLVLIMAALYHFHPEIYRVLEAHLSSFFERLWMWCADREFKLGAEHDCLSQLEKGFKLTSVAELGMNELPPMNSLHADYSRGNVLRIQELIYHARAYTDDQIRALLLK